MRVSFAQYVSELHAALLKVDQNSLNLAVSAIKQAERVFVAGNGGSASIADHLCCDFLKSKIRVFSLVANSAINTALANDEGYENAIAIQVRQLMTPRDLLILVSSSGNSPNILAAVRAAKETDITVIGITGFEGARLRDQSSIALHVPSTSYGIAEDAAQALMHYLSLRLRSEEQSNLVHESLDKFPIPKLVP